MTVRPPGSIGTRPRLCRTSGSDTFGKEVTIMTRARLLIALTTIAAALSAVAAGFADGR
jgi:hypothetical protein